MTRRDVALFLSIKNEKLSEMRETVKRYPAKHSFLENSYRKRTEKEKNESMKLSSKHYNTIEMEDDNYDPNVQSVRKHTN